MKIWITEIRAIDPLTGEMKTWGGENVVAPTFKMAEEWCKTNRGYLRVMGELISEVPCDDDYTPDWVNRIDYDTPQLN